MRNRCLKPREGFVLRLAFVAAILAPTWGASIAKGSSVTVGGIYLATDLITAANSALFRAYPNTAALHS